MASRSRVSGLTLIELLLAIVILSMLIGIATYSFSLFARHWSDRNQSFEISLAQFQRLDLLVTALSDALPWLVRNSDGAIGYYFLGRKEGVTLVTDSPIFADQTPALIRVFGERQTDGLWRLVYEEAPLDEVSLRSVDQVLPFTKRLVVLRNLRSLDFRYFGWTSVEARSGDAPEGATTPPEWRYEYDGILFFQHPIRLAMTLDGVPVYFELPDRTDSVLRAVGPE